MAVYWDVRRTLYELGGLKGYFKQKVVEGRLKIFKIDGRIYFRQEDVEGVAEQFFSDSSAEFSNMEVAGGSFSNMQAHSGELIMATEEVLAMQDAPPPQTPERLLLDYQPTADEIVSRKELPELVREKKSKPRKKTRGRGKKRKKTPGAAGLAAPEQPVDAPRADATPGEQPDLVDREVEPAHSPSADVAERPPAKKAFEFKPGMDLPRVDKNSLEEFIAVIETHNCIECEQCEIACLRRHGWSRIELNRRPASLYEPTRACHHCGDPAACVVACGFKAMAQVDGLVFLRTENCTGCTKCSKACPFDSIIMEMPLINNRGKTIVGPSKCDLCVGYDDLACETACPTDCIRRVPLEVYRQATGVGVTRHIRAKALLATSAILLLLVSVVVATFFLPPKPSSTVGLWTALLGTTLMAVSMLYVVRKRTRLLGRGDMHAWLWFHVVTGTLGAVLTFMHSGFKFGLNPATFGLALVGGISFTGVFGFFLWSHFYFLKVPFGDRLKGKVQDALEDLEKMKLAARAGLDDPDLAPAARTQREFELERINYEMSILDLGFLPLKSLRAVLSTWRVLHYTLASCLVIVATLHVLTALLYKKGAFLEILLGG